MFYEFSITDSNDFTKEQIMNEALEMALIECSFLGISEKPSITLVSESEENDQKTYKFVAKTVASNSSNEDDNSSETSSKAVYDDGFAASPSL